MIKAADSLSDKVVTQHSTNAARRAGRGQQKRADALVRRGDDGPATQSS